MRSILYDEDDLGLYDHEGYVAHVLDNGASAGATWTADIERRTVGWRCECSCGWAGQLYDSHGPNTPTDEQHDTMMDSDWDIHARPLLPLAGLSAAAREAAEATTKLRKGVARARAGGMSWEQIGNVLGVSRQAAWERFGAAASWGGGVNAEWLAATWADVSVGTVVRDVDGRVGEVMSVQRQSRHRPAGHGLAVEVMAPDGTWSQKAVEATNFVEIAVSPG